ncbi:hypothetical protein M3M39_00600 [Fructilactobacillus hinvesii]|uniref:NAD(P)H-binding protein n=1 Tax=Fructilactobacillus hinvesii TaxID=2940300 RepID=A0ABY5BUS6_9LACO|nr:hypothetical protein [Fructilactobacillus hinvesii]USS88021.1 hypothetical protein M3M39_00600 [Fructilactobacillus hinvesii]
MKYAITAATGRFGQLVVNQLLDKVPFRDIVIIARNLEKAHQLFPPLFRHPNGGLQRCY